MLFLDCGNTAVKCMLNDVVTSFNLADPRFNPLFNHYINDIDTSTLVVISSVAPAKIAQAIMSVLSKHFKKAPQKALTEASYGDLKIGYQVTQQLGVDRWLALIATQHLSAPRIIIDAGSWIKMDVVLKQGQHQGGVIISKNPNIEDDIFNRFALSPDDCPVNNELFGTSTRQCLCLAKSHYNFNAIAVFLTRWLPFIKQPCHIVVSGGDALHVIQTIKNIDAALQKHILDIQHIENLVLSGLSIRYSG